MRPLALLFNVEGKQLGQITALGAMLGIEVRSVPKSRYGEAIESLCENSAALQGSAAVADFSEPMMVMVNFLDGLLERFLSGFRTLNIERIALKAMVTPTNIRWTPPTLCAELKREHTAMTTHP